MHLLLVFVIFLLLVCKAKLTVVNTSAFMQTSRRKLRLLQSLINICGTNCRIGPCLPESGVIKIHEINTKCKSQYLILAIKLYCSHVLKALLQAFLHRLSAEVLNESTV